MTVDSLNTVKYINTCVYIWYKQICLSIQYFLLIWPSFPSSSFVHYITTPNTSTLVLYFKQWKNARKENYKTKTKKKNIIVLWKTRSEICKREKKIKNEYLFVSMHGFDKWLQTYLTFFRIASGPTKYLAGQNILKEKKSVEKNLIRNYNFCSL